MAKAPCILALKTAYVGKGVKHSEGFLAIYSHQQRLKRLLKAILQDTVCMNHDNSLDRGSSKLRVAFR
jgi:hypothetical protein